LSLAESIDFDLPTGDLAGTPESFLGSAMLDLSNSLTRNSAF
jgi:hypothetical protein